jgi:hypothetical protein
VNKIIAMYLHYITSDHPWAWLDWLLRAKYCYNTSFHSELCTTSFQIVYGRPPPPLVSYELATARTTTVDTLLQDRDMFLANVRDRLLWAQEYAKHFYNTHHRLLEFNVSDWVWLRILHRPVQSLVSSARSKLSLHYAGPFQVLERVGEVTYRLQLPVRARIHDVFHVGVLKPFHGASSATTLTLPPLRHGLLVEIPKCIIKAQLCRGVSEFW